MHFRTSCRVVVVAAAGFACIVANAQQPPPPSPPAPLAPLPSVPLAPLPPELPGVPQAPSIAPQAPMAALLAPLTSASLPSAAQDRLQALIKPSDPGQLPATDPGAAPMVQPQGTVGATALESVRFIRIEPDDRFLNSAAPASMALPRRGRPLARLRHHCPGGVPPEFADIRPIQRATVLPPPAAHHHGRDGQLAGHLDDGLRGRESGTSYGTSIRWADIEYRLLPVHIRIGSFKPWFSRNS